MAKIFQMSQHMADLIAAGEVVERPASVVKELVENAVDAGAKAVTVEIKNGGMTYIRVTDDGCGIAPEDVPTAFLRHATSKLRTEEELAAIKTLGFRGEALAAICAVSRTEMFTRERGAAEGTFISLDGGKVVENTPAGCPEGTTIIIRDLFFNTPARLKFMKKDSSEGSAVSAAVVRTALSRPELSLRYIKDGKEEMHTPGDGSIESCIYAALGRDFSNTMLRACAADEHVSAEGYVSSPNGARGNRSHQFFFVNGRFVKSQLLQAALEQAYRNSLFSGRFPACVLYLKMNPASVDVNVHPAKTEVKFLSERQVFDAVYYAARAALGAEETLPELRLSGGAARQADVLPPRVLSAPAPQPPAPAGKREQESYGSGGGFKTSIAAGSLGGAKKYDFEQTRLVYNTAPPEAPPSRIAPAVETPEVSENPPYRIIGEAMSSYIIVERGESILLIDKHAAHERMLFDGLKRQGREIASQELLTPFIAKIGNEEAEALLSQSALLGELGFDIEPFGGGAVAVNCIPMDINVSDTAALLAEISEDIKIGRRPNSLGIRDEILASIACKAAVKAGCASDAFELRPLVEKVISGEVKYCPHGRPVTMELSKRTLDNNFRRT